uniref:NAD(P)H-quinone oxidoreductase subunit 5, chloroplastic n=1 Tax=Vachellia nilotica TaxID=138033 RepID=A0A650F2N4_9FABA|nr:NADH-plastoquinone oxidoreductase subunit 5 [Vachellia nilotica]QGT77198.1 NADH-plastoquinone oxidoreductase subunit 5 [Vachellia nilotica]
MGIYTSIFMDHTLHSTSSSYVNRSGTSPFSRGNKKKFAVCGLFLVFYYYVLLCFFQWICLFIKSITVLSINMYGLGLYIMIFLYSLATCSIHLLLLCQYCLLLLEFWFLFIVTIICLMMKDICDFLLICGFFNTSMLGLVTSSNLIQIYIFWELVGMCSYLLIGFWFTRPIAANACQKAFVTNRVGDFCLLLGILGLYWITGSLEFRDLFEIFNNLILNNEVNLLLVTLCAFLLFGGSVAKSAQFPLHVWLPDAMEGPTPISALIHAATMVAAGIFLVARLLPLFIVIPFIMNGIAFIGIITVVLGATLALAQKDIKRSLAYSTMSQLGYMMLALGMGSYRAALFHLITHAYSKALLFLGSGSIIHSMEAIVGYSPDKSQNMVLMGGLTKHVPITKTAFLVGTLSLCGIPPFACFWSKDEILNDSWLYSPIFAIIACSTAGLTAFYMFRIYLLVFEGYLNVNCKNFNGKKNSSFHSISLWGKEKEAEKKKCIYYLYYQLIIIEGLPFFGRRLIHIKLIEIYKTKHGLLLMLPILKLTTLLFPIPMNRKILCYFLCLYYYYLLCSSGSYEFLLTKKDLIWIYYQNFYFRLLIFYIQIQIILRIGMNLSQMQLFRSVLLFSEYLLRPFSINLFFHLYYISTYLIYFQKKFLKRLLQIKYEISYMIGHIIVVTLMLFIEYPYLIMYEDLLNYIIFLIDEYLMEFPMGWVLQVFFWEKLYNMQEVAEFLRIFYCIFFMHYSFY